MNKIISENTVFPTRILQEDYYSIDIIDDYMEKLKPKPDKETLLIIGDGANVLDDIGRWYEIAEGLVDYDTMCLNYAALICPHEFQHFAAGDSHMPDMQKIAHDLPEKVIKHAWNPGSTGFDVRWVRNGRGGWSGTSANLAYKIGLALDYTRIVLAGCPMDNSGNWYSKIVQKNDVKASKDHRHHLWKWCEMATRPIGKFLRSMSGNTADLFGEPTRDWLLFIPENSNLEGERRKWKTN